MGGVLIAWDPPMLVDRLDLSPEDKALLLREVFRSVDWEPKTRPDSPVPSLQGPCDRSLKSEVPCGSCLNWR